MKLKFLIVVILLNFSSVFSQEDKTVTLTVSAQGQTISEAKQNALRDAIEQAFGAFISSNTEILNDELVKDEIVSVSNGNIQDYDVISEVELPNGSYATTLKATVSVTKLTSFVESKGVSVEFKGGLFAFNVNQQMLNEKNEVKAIKDLCQVIKNIADTSFDYTITVSAPKSINNDNSKWKIPFYVSVFKNKNFDKLTQLLYETLKGLTLTNQELDDYRLIDKETYTVSIALSEIQYSQIFLRKKESITELLKVLYYFNHSLQNFKINNGIDEWQSKDYYTKGVELGFGDSEEIRKAKLDKTTLAVKKYYGDFSRDRRFGFQSISHVVENVYENEKDDSQATKILRKLVGLKCIYDGGFRIFYNSSVSPISVFYKSHNMLLDRHDVIYLDGYQASTENFKCYPCIPFTEALYKFKVPNKTKSHHWNNQSLQSNVSVSFLKTFDNDSDLVISFIAVNKIDNSFHESFSRLYFRGKYEVSKGDYQTKGELVRFYYEDIRTLDEIQNISEYTVKPISLYSSLSSTNYENKPKVSDKSNEASVVFKSTHYVNDPDGWTNFRDAPRGKILKRLDNKLQCKFLSSENGWALVELKSSEKGYIHSTRLKSNSSKIFKIKIQKNRTNINIRKKPVNGVVVGQVSGGELYTVTDESPTDSPIYLLNNDMVLTDFKTGEKIDKPKDFKLNNVSEHINNTYYAELINTDKTINKVYIEKNKVKIEYNSWFYLEEIKGWIYSIFCEKM